MEEKMHWVPTSIGMIVLAIIFGGLSLAIYPGLDVVWDFLLKIWRMRWDSAPAWVQAIGSIGAILAAVFIAKWQVDTGRTSAERAAKAQFNQVMAGIISFEKMALEHESFDTRDIFFVRMHKSLLEDNLEIARTIKFSDLDRFYAALLGGVRATLIQLISSLDKADSDQIETDSGGIKISKNAHAELMKSIKIILRKYHDTINMTAEKVRSNKK